MEARPLPLRVLVTDVAVRQSIVGQRRRHEGLNPALIVVQRPVRIISDPPSSGVQAAPEEDADERVATLPAKAAERPDELADELELDGEELESDVRDEEDEEELFEVSVPPPAPPEALRRTSSAPAPAERPERQSEPIVEIEIEEARTTPPESGRLPSPPPPIPPLSRAATPSPEPTETNANARTARAQEVRPTKPRSHVWWEVFFDDDYLRTVRQPTPQQIARQCDFIVARLGLKPGATVLDVGCGLGLHVAELASRGFASVGLDLSLAMLSRASDEAQTRGLHINFLHSDMRELTFDGSFDAVTCLGTTLGYFDDETNRKVIERLLRALKPGGALLLDVVNRDHVIRSQPNLIWFEGDGCVCMEESEFNFFTSRLHVKRTVILDNGRQVESEYSLRLYSLHELGQLMNASGFRVTEVSGREALPGVFFGQESPNLMIVAVRRTANGAAPVAPANTNASPE